jgi:hypothetical protein
MQQDKLRWCDLVGRTVKRRFLERNGFQRGQVAGWVEDTVEYWVVPHWNGMHGGTRIKSDAVTDKRPTVYRQAIEVRYGGGQEAEVVGFMPCEWGYIEDNKSWQGFLIFEPSEREHASDPLIAGLWQATWEIDEDPAEVFAEELSHA